MARVIELIIEKHPEIKGLWQVSSEPISKLELLQIAKERFRWKGEIVPDSSFVCDRSLNSERFRKATAYRPPDWPSMIDEISQAV
jgi:dTDP-4-dehydrorhamnose reductase